MKLKIRYFLVFFLSFFICFIGSVKAAIPTNTEVVIKFYKNGATLSTPSGCTSYSDRVECRCSYDPLKLGYCVVQAPTIKRSGWEILGYGNDSTSTIGKYKSGEKLNVTASTQYYAVTHAIARADFYKNGFSLKIWASENNSKCTSYSDRVSCIYHFYGNNVSKSFSAPYIDSGSSYESIGYATSNNSNSIVVKSNSMFKVSANQNLNYYTVALRKLYAYFYANDLGSLDNHSPGCVYGTSVVTCSCLASESVGHCTIDVPGFTPKSGYKFLGYRLKNSSSSTINNNKTMTLSISEGGAQYVAVAKYVTRFSATFYKNNATLSKPNGCVDNGNTVVCTCETEERSCSITAPTITRSDYTINGFSTSINSSVIAYKSGANIVLRSDQTYYASTTKKSDSGSDPEPPVPTKKTFKATFKKNGAKFTNTPSGCSVDGDTIVCKCEASGTSCDITAPIAERSGYTVLGYGKSETQTSDLSTNGGKISLSSDMIYYVITKEVPVVTNKYTAIFLGNGATFVDAPAGCSFSGDAIVCMCEAKNGSCEITAPTFKRAGYTVVGYGNTSSSISKKFDISSKVTLSGDARYYAITYKKLDITFKMSDKILGLKETSYDTAKNEDVTLSCKLYNTDSYCGVKTPLIVVNTEDGLTVAGWNIKESATNGSTPGQYTFVSSDTIYYPIVLDTKTAVKYTATFVTNSLDFVAGKSLSCTTVTGKTCTVTALEFTKNGYNSLGWSLKKNSTKADYKIGEEIELSKNITLYPVYEQIKSNDNSGKADNGGKDTGTTENVGTGISSLIYVLVPIALGTGVLLYTKKIKRN